MSVGKEVLAKIVYENRVQDFGRLKPHWFAQDEREIYDDIQKFLTMYGQLPPIEQKLIKERLTPFHQERMPYSAVFDELVKRNLTLELTNLGVDLDNAFKKNDPHKALDMMKAFVFKFETDQRQSKDVYSYQELGSMVLDYIEENRFKDGMIGVPFGWPTFDTATCGAQGGNVYGVLARPKSGKSIALAYMAETAYNAGYIPMLVSMEMKAIEFARRLIAQRAGISMTTLKRGKISFIAEQRIRDAIGTMRTPFYLVEGQLKKDLSEVASLIYGLRPDIVYLDGGYLVKIAGGGKMATWEVVKRIIEELKTISMVANIPVVVSFQFNREVNRRNAKTGSMDNIQLSDAIAQVFSTAIGIFEEDENLNRRRVEIIGGREGESGAFFMNWDWERMNFSEIIMASQQQPTEDLAITGGEDGQG